MAGHLGRKMKAARQAAKDGKLQTAWEGLQMDRGGNRCKGCGKRWDKMSKRDLIRHAECSDKDGCPETEDD